MRQQIIASISPYNYSKGSKNLYERDNISVKVLPHYTYEANSLSAEVIFTKETLDCWRIRKSIRKSEAEPRFSNEPIVFVFQTKTFVTHVSFRATRVLPSDSHNSFAYLGPIKFLTLSWFFKSNSEFIHFTHKSYQDSIFHFFSRKSIDHLPVYFKSLRFMFAYTIFSIF